MTNEEFQIWLSGYVELEEKNFVLTAKQLWIIHNHLMLVEAVSGELNEKNKWLKSRLQGLDSRASIPSMSNQFKKITQQIHNWLASDKFC